MRQYEIIVKVGPTPSPCGRSLLWDSVKSYYRDGLDAARTKRDEERRKNRDAIIAIRDVETLQLAG